MPLSTLEFGSVGMVTRPEHVLYYATIRCGHCHRVTRWREYLWKGCVLPICIPCGKPFWPLELWLAAQVVLRVTDDADAFKAALEGYPC